MSPKLLLLCCVLSVTVPVQLSQFSNKGFDFCIGKNLRILYDTHFLVGTTSSSPVDFTIQYSINQSFESNTTLATPYLNLYYDVFSNTEAICFTSGDGLIVLGYSMRNSSSIDVSASYLALPYQELVTDQYEYYTLSTSSSDDQYYSGFMLVGLRDDTTITIYPSVPLNVQQNATSNIYIMVQPDQNHTVVLHRQQTLYIGADGGALDATGTRIISDKPLTVISGHEAGSVPSNGPVQPMAQQIPPTQLWGDTFMIVPMMGHSDGQSIKVLSSVDYTEISYNCHQSSNTAMLLKAGSVLQFYVPDNSHCSVKANNSVLVGQFPYSPKSSNNDGATTMILVPSIDQYYNNVTFWTLNTTNNYISITVPVEGYNHSNILYDGGSIPKECWSPVYDISINLIGYGCRLAVSKGYHTVSNGNGLLSVLVYGFGIGHAYGYPTALHFTPSKVLGVYFSSDEYTIHETEGSVTIIINRVTHLTSEDHYQLNITADGGINSGRLTPVSQYVVFPPMESSVSVPIIINDNDIIKGNEYYTVQLCRVTDPLRDVCIQAGIRVLDDDVSAVIGITECSGHFTSPEKITWSLTIALTNETLPPGVNCNITTYIIGSSSTTPHVTQCPNVPSSITQYLSFNGSHNTMQLITSKLLVTGTNIIMIDPDTCQRNITYSRTSTSSFIPTATSVSSSTPGIPVSHTVAITLGTVLPLMTLVTVTAVIIAIYTCYRMRKVSSNSQVYFSDPSEGRDSNSAKLITSGSIVQ